jgi:predicted nucleic acid-binding protein
MGIWYLDSSALVKLVAVEAHSAAMYRWQEEAEARLVTCDLGEAEVLRAVRRVDTALLDRARAVLSTIDIVPLDRSHLSRAALIAPAHLRTLDAIHVVTALDLGDRLQGFVTYNERQAAAARDHGLRVESPV